MPKAWSFFDFIALDNFSSEDCTSEELNHQKYAFPGIFFVSNSSTFSVNSFSMVD